MTKLRTIRRQCRMTQQELATKAGITRVALVRIERGQADPKLSTLYQLAAALNVAPSMLLDDPKTRNQ